MLAPVICGQQGKHLVYSRITLDRQASTLPHAVSEARVDKFT